MKNQTVNGHTLAQARSKQLLNGPTGEVGVVEQGCGHA